MAANGLRGRLLPAVLPTLLFVLLVLVAAPQRTTPAPRAAVAGAAVEVSSEQPDPVVESAVDAAPAPADRSAVLLSQFTAGVRGSRAPPAASA